MDILVNRVKMIHVNRIHVSIMEYAISMMMDLIAIVPMGSLVTDVKLHHVHLSHALNMLELTQKNVNWLLLLTNPQKKYVNMQTNVFWRDSLISASAVIDTPVRIVNLLHVILIHVRMDQNVVLLNKS